MSAMQWTVATGAPGGFVTPLLIVPLTEGEAPHAALDEALRGALSAVIRRGDFRGRKDDVLLVAGPGNGIERAVLVGTGRKEEVSLDRLRSALGHGIRCAERVRVTSAAAWLDPIVAGGYQPDAESTAHLIVETAGVAAWDFRDLKTPNEADPPVFVESFTLLATQVPEAVARRGAAHGDIVARAINLARGLATRPGNIATPGFLAQTAKDIADRFGMNVTVLDRPAMEKEGMRALLAVAQGTEQDPRFIALEYRGGGAGQPPLVIVGKGVTFDSGGISLKPAERMEEMKYDMSGAAATLGAMQAIAELGLRANVVGLIPATENLPSGRAVKPGDVIGSLGGKTIEVVSTDAEGRLILADALAWAQRYKPEAILDAATLTGAVVIALGHHAIGLMGNDDALVEEIRAIGEQVGERCWPLPLWAEYREQIDSTVGDVKNTGGRPAGSITAGWFLREFVGEVPWAHLDIAGTAWRDEAAPWLRKGATGIPTRIFIEWVRSRTER
ncbi:MAG: leucyl aminopeptidase [Gemmatimonadetes bacterium]|nr:leucyl aminopeptidase [Gemmatimonadota bacterium]